MYMYIITKVGIPMLSINRLKAWPLTRHYGYMKELTKYMGTRDTMWIHTSMTQSYHSSERIHSGATS